MKQATKHWRGLLAVTIACTALTACSDEQSDQKGSGNMFGLFGKKSVKSRTSVAAQLGATLQRRDALPSQLPPPVMPAFPACQLGYFRGDPQEAQWTPEEVQGETRRVFRIPAGAGFAPLAVFASAGSRAVQVWELSNDNPARFMKQRDVALDPAQASWTLAYPVAVACLPGRQAAVAVGYHDPIKQNALFIYNAATNQFRRIDQIEPERSHGAPFVPFEILAAAPEAMLVLYHTDSIRLAAENYAYQYDHVLLISHRHPQGIEILKLSIDDGNVRAWAMQGNTLWLQTADKRKPPSDFTWSLELDKVL